MLSAKVRANDCIARLGGDEFGILLHSCQLDDGINIVNDPIDYEIVHSITEIGHAMGKKVVAEAVEHELILEKLVKIGCDYAQGFAVGSPVPLDEIV